MKPEFINYFTEIGLSANMIEALNSNYQVLAKAANLDEFDDVLLSETISRENNREYLSLWAFNQKMLCKFTMSNSYDENKIVLFRIKNNVSRFSFINFNFDLVNVRENSILNTSFRTFDNDALYNISASGRNCLNLLQMSWKYFIPNIIN
jgi:hypothetical protein